MLTSRSVESGFALADEFADKGFSIVPVANTPLAFLFKATNDLACCYSPTNAAEAVNEAEILSSITELAREIELNSTNAYKLHDQEMDKYVKVIKNSVNNHLDITKNIVKPIVIELMEMVTESFNKDMARNPSDDFNVIAINPCPILSMAGFSSMLEKYENKLPALPKEKIKLKADIKLQESDVYNIITDYYSDLKAEMIDWFNEVNDGFLTDSNYTSDDDICFAFSSFFTKCPDDVESVNPTKFDLKTDDLTLLNKLIVLYTVALYIYERPEFGIGYTLGQYKEAVAQLRDYAGARICQYMKKLDILNRSQTLILRMSRSSNVIYVNGPIYRAWLQDGNSPEILYSILLNGEGMVTIPTIDTSKVMLMEKWKKWNVLKEVAYKNNSLQRFKDHLRLAFLDQLKDIQEIELLYFNQDKRKLVETVMKRFEENLANLKMHSMDNVLKTCRKLVCRSRFFYTPADKLLSSIEEYSNSNPDIDPQEAALMATIEYVADFVAEQLNLSTKL